MKRRWCSTVPPCYLRDHTQFEICNNSNSVTAISVRTKNNLRKVRTCSLPLSFRKDFYAFISLWICEEHECMHVSLWENIVFNNSLKVNCLEPFIHVNGSILDLDGVMEFLLFCLLINFELNLCKFCTIVCEEEGIKKSRKIAVWQ